MRVQFGDTVLDSGSRQLVRGGAAIHLSPKAFDLLCHLVERRPSAVSKDQLFELVWPGTFVVEANLTVLVAELRRALGDDPHTPRFIRTLHKHGYAFCGQAIEIAPPPPARDALRVWLLWNDRVLPLAEGENVIGRDPSCGVWLDQPGVSRRHARVVVTDDVAEIEDLGSTNGTFVNEIAIGGPRQLRDAEMIQVGSVDLKYRSWSPSRPVETERIRRAK
ncbi:MAG TPA: FHA domain-containing protein [Vicinamibacterales bacterium]|nr:FHA domain-containing protein [Vicinamibacterales bacterium]